MAKASEVATFRIFSSTSPSLNFVSVFMYWHPLPRPIYRSVVLQVRRAMSWADIYEEE
jgi:hypothetical protein